MNKLPIPEHDDGAAFYALAHNNKVKSFPRLQPLVASVQAAYSQYVGANGNPYQVTNLAIEADLAEMLKAHYKSPPASHKYIRDMRDSTTHKVCSMCGSLHSGTLDHYLPQQEFPAFTVFSQNLVPACLCNSRRGDALLGPGPEERILHPYFDDCLAERLMRASFHDLGDVPQVDVILAIPSTHPNYAAVAFHFRSIVRRTGVLRYVADEWSKLMRKPSLAVRALENGAVSSEALREILQIELDRLDDEHGSKNNWRSIFVAGLLDQAVVDWLFQRLSYPGRGVDAPLINGLT